MNISALVYTTLVIPYLEILQVIGYLLGGAAGARVLDYVLKRKSNTNNKLIIASLKRLADIYQDLDIITNETPVKRAIIWKGHDTGFIPQPGNPYYISALHWSTNLQTGDNDSEYIASRYQNIQVDGPYIKLILELMEKKHISIDVVSMDPCMLKNIYLAVGIKYCELYYIGSAKNVLYYISLTSLEKIDYNDPRVSTLLKLSVDKIRENFNLQQLKSVN